MAADSVYRVTELVGTSTQSWAAAAKTAIETASKTLRDLRVAEVVRQDVTIEREGRRLPGAVECFLQVRRSTDSAAESQEVRERHPPQLCWGGIRGGGVGRS